MQTMNRKGRKRERGGGERVKNKTRIKRVNKTPRVQGGQVGKWVGIRRCFGSGGPLLLFYPSLSQLRVVVDFLKCPFVRVFGVSRACRHGR